MTLVPLLVLASAARAQRPDRFVGLWQGELNGQSVRLRLGLIVQADGPSGLRGTLISIDQNNATFPATLVRRGDSLDVAVANLNIKYVAALTNAADGMVGMFEQGALKQSLTMVRVPKIEVAASPAVAVPMTYPTHLASDSAIRALLVKRIDEQRRSIGIVVGVIEPTGRRVIAYGHPAKGDARLVDDNTVYEIGSMTKVFTSLVLADMARKHEVSLDDPVAKYLPADVTVPRRNGKQITLRDLSTHTSGLPRLPLNLAPRDSANPYADYTAEKLYAFLSSYTLPRDPGAQYEYSNLGAGLLGVALARRAGVDYATLVRTRVLEPLHLASTSVALTPDMMARAATGYITPTRAAEYWDFDALACAGALRSTANDMLDFLAANLGFTTTPLASAMAEMTETSMRRPTGVPELQVALAWHIITHDGHETIWHDGGTDGFRSYIGFDRARRVGVVVLSNSAAPEGVIDLGAYILNGGGSLYEPPPSKPNVP